MHDKNTGNYKQPIGMSIISDDSKVTENDIDRKHSHKSLISGTGAEENRRTSGKTISNRSHGLYTFDEGEIEKKVDEYVKQIMSSIDFTMQIVGHKASGKPIWDFVTGDPVK
jgi:hypothetical protein